GHGMGDFIERYIFPGGELAHVAAATEAMARGGLEPVDIESLRPHYARTLWAWSDALEARLDEARRHTTEKVVRAYRVYLAGCAMCFERGWISLHQMLATRPDGQLGGRPLRGQQSIYPYNRSYIYRDTPPAA
ncbi:MAG: class I SAM-dependent methyltransferase, partial [Betaproteobacteria bacterium]|nr:class I SAM-dependent methyltransferase [Betaproteobacteria bacterium]